MKKLTIYAMSLIILSGCAFNQKNSPKEVTLTSKNYAINDKDKIMLIDSTCYSYENMSAVIFPGKKRGIAIETHDSVGNAMVVTVITTESEKLLVMR